MDTIKLSEMFGPTIQGEGSRSGRLAAFIRVWGCPLYCWFCDSAYTWRVNDKHSHKQETVTYNPKEQIKEMSFTEVLASLRDMRWPPLIVFTGGEPLLYDEKLTRLGLLIVSNMIAETGYVPEFEVETAGVIKPDRLSLMAGLRFNVSPKLASSQVALNDRLNLETLEYYAKLPATTFKFVITDPIKDIAEIKKIQNMARISDRQIYLMPEGETQAEQVRRFKLVMELAIDNHWNFSPRLHTMAWGNERGR